MLEEQQHVVRQPARDPVFRELTLPLERLAVGHQPSLDDLQETRHAAPIPLPLIAQRVARMPNAMFSRSHTIIPNSPKTRPAAAARNPGRIARMPPSRAIPPPC